MPRTIAIRTGGCGPIPVGPNPSLCGWLIPPSQRLMLGALRLSAPDRASLGLPPR